jgi:beta-lactamase class A
VPSVRLLIVLLAGAATLAPSVGLAGDQDLVRARVSRYPAAEVAAARAGSPEAVQDAYGAARDLQEAIRASAPVSAECRPLLLALTRYSAARVLQMEGVDRPSAADRAAGRRRAERARAAVASAARSCRGRGGGPRVPRLALSPSDGELFYGTIVARAPTGATSATLEIAGRAPQTASVVGGRVRFAVPGEGRLNLRVRFARGAVIVGSSGARSAWLLPPSARAAVPGSRSTAALTTALAHAVAGGPAFRAAWIQDLTTGEVASFNARSLFPAASTVKLGLLAAVLGRLGGAPERSAYADDLRALTGWSSNLATNRLLRRFGVAAATEGLRRLDARRSTFPGEYLVGTELQPGLPAPGAGASPPSTSRRVTTAEDLGRMLYSLQAAAVGLPAARAQTGLTAHRARLALGWLLASQQRGDNLSLLAGGAAGAPIAQKNGWLNSARHGAGIIFTPRGPVIAVVISDDDRGVSLGQGRALGSRVAALAIGAHG